MLTACGGTGKSSSAIPPEEYGLNESGYPIVEEPITLKVAVAGAATNELNDTEMVKYIKEEFNIELDCVPYNGNDWSTEFTLMMAGDNLPDLVLNVSTGIVAINKYAEDGYFLAINDYLDYAPNLKSLMEKYPEYEKIITSADGNIYGLTQVDENLYNRVNRCFIDQRWLANVNMEMPTTLDELYNVLKAFKEQDANGNGDPNDEIPLSDVTGFNRGLVPILQAFGLPTNDMVGGRCVDDEGKVYFPYITENYKAYLKYMNKLYEEGLLDNNVYVQTSDEYKEKIANETVGMYGAAAPYAYAGKNVEYDANFNSVMGLTSEWCEEGYYVMNSSVTTTVKALISADTKYPEACVRLLDYFCSEEGGLTACVGIEGVTYDLYEKDYAPGIPVQQVRQPEGYSSPEEYRYKKAVISSGFNILQPLEKDQPQVVSQSSEEALYGDQMVKDFGWYVLLERQMRNLKCVEGMTSLAYTEEESNRKSTISTDIKTYIKQITCQFVMGKADIDEYWDTYIQTINQMGIEEWMEIEQTAYDRMTEK